MNATVEARRDEPVNEQDMANAIRMLSADAAVQQANSGHPGMPMGMADVATVLFTRYLKFNAADADWPDRDRFVLSAGHGSMLIYSLLHLTGYAAMTRDELRNFRQLGSRTAGSSRIRTRPRHRDDDGTTRPGHYDGRRHGTRRTICSTHASVTNSSITAPG